MHLRIDLDDENGKKPVRHPHCCSVFSSVFKEQMLTVCAKAVIPTLTKADCFSEASCHANGV